MSTVHNLCLTTEIDFLLDPLKISHYSPVYCHISHSISTQLHLIIITRHTSVQPNNMRTHSWAQRHTEEKLHTYKRKKCTLSCFYLFLKTLQGNSNILSKRNQWGRQRVIPFRTKTPLEEKQSKWLTGREEEREEEGGGGKTRQRGRGWLEERGRASAGASWGGKKQGESRDREIGRERGRGEKNDKLSLFGEEVLICPHTVSGPWTVHYFLL